jgi:hypothetical protein
MQPKKFFRRKQSKKLRLSLYSWIPDRKAQKLITSALMSVRIAAHRPAKLAEVR